jgi:hypothetical protein
MTDYEGMQRKAYQLSNGNIPTHIPGLLNSDQQLTTLEQQN